jgi:hypothetical protein
MVSKIMVGLAIVLCVFVALSLYFETSLFFQQVSIDPIKVYYKSEYGIVANGTVAGNPFELWGWSGQNWSVSNIQVTFDNAFDNSNMHFELSYDNLSINSIGLHSIGNDQIYVNLTEVQEYKQSNLPDMLITFPPIQNGSYLCYRDILDISSPQFGTYAKQVSCAPFFKRTSFNTWQAEILLDSSMGTVNLTSIDPEDNRTFATVSVKSLEIKMDIPKDYQIQNIESINTASSSNGVSVTKDLVSGQTFDFIVTKSSLSATKTVMDYVSSIGIPAIIMSIFLDAFIERAKAKKERTLELAEEKKRAEEKRLRREKKKKAERVNVDINISRRALSAYLTNFGGFSWFVFRNGVVKRSTVSSMALNNCSPLSSVFSMFLKSHLAYTVYSVLM